jgi:uncharacterized protein (DUF2236 family)
MPEQVKPIRRDDYGFFGPGSPSWQVWTSPTALIGFQRAVVLEHFNPYLAAAVADSAGIYRDPSGRLDRTLAYFLTVAVADGRTAVEASEVLMRVHAKANGVEPITGSRYSANNPAAQLWIHVTGWHSVLKCYERYGPGPLSAAEESRFWAEARIAAELQTCRPSDVPASRDEVRQYFADVRDRLCTSEHADKAMRYLLWTPCGRGGRRGGPRRPHAGARAYGRELARAGHDGTPAGAADRRGARRASGRRATGAAADGHAGRGSRGTGRAGLASAEAFAAKHKPLRPSPACRLSGVSVGA